jgi:formate dehydrogenase subunit gamma
VPASPPPDLAPRLAEILAAHRDMEGPLLPILHAVQAEWGHVPEEVVVPIAEALNLGRAEVHGVISFYHDFRHEPAGRIVLRLCAAEACQAQGGRDLSASVLKAVGLPGFGTTSDGRVTVEPVYCLGLCASGPAAQVDGRLVGRATPHALAEALR